MWQTAVRTHGSRGSAQPVGNLALHHQHGACQQTTHSGRKQPYQDRRGDVVRQIADNIRALARPDERGEVNFENVGLYYFDMGLGAHTEAQFGGKRSIDLDGYQPLAARGKDRCDGSVSRADLDHRARGEISQRVHNGLPRSLIDKEVLAEFGLAHHISLCAQNTRRGL